MFNAELLIQIKRNKFGKNKPNYGSHNKWYNKTKNRSLHAQLDKIKQI